MMRSNPRIGRQHANGRASGREHPAKVQLRYDRTVDALAIELAPDARSARTVCVAPGVNFDFDGRERLICIEVLDASTRIPRSSLDTLPSAADWLTLEEAAAESGLAPSTLRVQINNGRLAATKRGRDWLVDATALLNYLESRDTRGRPPADRSLKQRGIARARRRRSA